MPLLEAISVESSVDHVHDHVYHFHDPSESFLADTSLIACIFFFAVPTFNDSFFRWSLFLDFENLIHRVLPTSLELLQPLV